MISAWRMSAFPSRCAICVAPKDCGVTLASTLSLSRSHSNHGPRWLFGSGSTLAAAPLGCTRWQLELGRKGCPASLLSLLRFAQPAAPSRQPLFAEQDAWRRPQVLAAMGAYMLATRRQHPAESPSTTDSAAPRLARVEPINETIKCCRAAYSNESQQKQQPFGPI